MLSSGFQKPQVECGRSICPLHDSVLSLVKVVSSIGLIPKPHQVGKSGWEVAFNSCSLPEIAVSVLEVQKAWHLLRTYILSRAGVNYDYNRNY